MVLVLALAAASQAVASGRPDAALVPKEQRTPAPKLVFSDIPGARRHLLQFKGKIVVVNFWATWCVPCKTEMPEFVQAYAAYRDRGVEFFLSDVRDLGILDGLDERAGRLAELHGVDRLDLDACLGQVTDERAGR